MTGITIGITAAIGAVQLLLIIALVRSRTHRD